MHYKLIYNLFMAAGCQIITYLDFSLCFHFNGYQNTCMDLRGCLRDSAKGSVKMQSKRGGCQNRGYVKNSTAENGCM